MIRGRRERSTYLITDVVMPRMDGPALIREVREIPPDMKVIFISGYRGRLPPGLDSDSEIPLPAQALSLKQLASRSKR